MNLTLTCKHCGAEVATETEDQLVERVEAHIHDHGGQHALPSREQILALVHRQQAKKGDAV
jgi:hypothetical protein